MGPGHASDCGYPRAGCTIAGPCGRPAATRAASPRFGGGARQEAPRGAHMPGAAAGWAAEPATLPGRFVPELTDARQHAAALRQGGKLPHRQAPQSPPSQPPSQMHRRDGWCTRREE